ncbi:MAG: hypothetical protein HZY73_11315 [Micropruina sp.]|nr:MAG: hypothetical protein HZY73_11315 [Micropruina sp.]
MSMTVYDPDETPAAGNVLIAFGAGFASIAAPKLSELTINATCSIEQFDTSTDVSYKSKQTLCMLDAEEQVDKRTRKIAPSRSSPTRPRRPHCGRS